MGIFAFKLPDLGEGIIEAELVEWHVAVGDIIEEGDEFADIMTDKATVEVPSPVDGKLIKLIGEPGQMVPVGSVIAEFEVEGGLAAIEEEPAQEAPKAVEISAPAPITTPSSLTAMKHATSHGSRAPGEKPVASPAVRGRAKQAGIDLNYVPSSGEAGRITHDDLDAFIASGGKIEMSSNNQVAAPSPVNIPEGSTEIKVIGLRRKIAKKMQEAKRQIPHITYVEEVDVTDVEALRQKLNAEKSDEQPKLTFLPFLMKAMVLSLAKYPNSNALYDDLEGIVHQYSDIHIGIASQTDNGLMVPVVRDAGSRDLWDNMAEVLRISTAAKDGSAKVSELSGSTITITSLGRMGGIVTTPVINRPEVAIIGVNNMVDRPVVKDGEIVIRKMMNLSSGFDHRIIDGYDAAKLIQCIKGLLEDPQQLLEG